MLAELSKRRVHLPDHAGVRIAPPLVFLAALAVGLFMQWALPVHLGVETMVAVFRGIGAALVLVGGWLLVDALQGMRAAGTSPVPVRPTTALVREGVYRYTRNPMYLGMLLVCAGVALVANALWPLVLLPLVVSVINREVIVREEKYLSRKFGGEYEVYKRRTRRWI